MREELELIVGFGREFLSCATNKKQPAQPTVYVYSRDPGSDEELVSYFSQNRRLITDATFKCDNFLENPLQAEILLQAVQRHVDAGYKVIFDKNPITKNLSPINSRIKTYLESKLKLPKKSKHAR